MKPRTAEQPADPISTSFWARHRILIVSGLLFAITLLVYAQVWNFGFICIDDSAYVTENTYVQQGITRPGLEWSFTTVHDANWIPFTWISLMLDTSLYGVRAGGYHITNVLLHAISAVLLFLALFRATGAWARSAFVAALFALHPLHVESVAWVAERKDVLSTLFGLLSLWAYVRYATGAARWNLAASLLCLVASLLAKQTLVTLPFVFLLLDFWPLGRWRRADSVSEGPANSPRSRRDPKPKAAKRDQRTNSAAIHPALRLIAEKIPFFAASAIFSWVALWAQSRSGAVIALSGYSLSERCMNAIVAYAAYLQKTLFPQNLAVYYPLSRDNLTWMAVGISATVLLAISVAAVVFIRRFPFVFVGWCWYLGTLVPMIGLVQIGSQQMADRYTYFPLIGIFLAATWLVPELVPAGALRSRVLPIAALASVLLLAATAFSQISYWHDSITLLHHSLECTVDNAAIHEFLGAANLSEDGDLHEAVQELEKALKFAPTYAPVRQNLGLALHRLGRIDEALVQYREAIALGENTPEVHVDLGRALFSRGQSDDAKTHFREALQLEPDFLPALLNFTIVCLATQDYVGAIVHGQRALELNPQLPECHVWVATALREQGHLDDALAHLNQAVALAPNDPAVREELTRAQAMKANGGAP
jgi:tetratricopeptide (TPR) repeat protein